VAVGDRGLITGTYCIHVASISETVHYLCNNFFFFSRVSRKQ